ncbi:hypothetical protein BHM03_00047978 [Ensete ventricosum]|uniref:Uncharacterized protein n=1 Tax=Ensete ventricosum TaxID=4639 RepID=A0A426XHC3_ENSVE|nr:hypothetical protein B296_00057426 [Ensete ventricosum]RZS16041.1 hypothetical protein BHM03_00047978 [Ensete ventricosum]
MYPPVDRYLDCSLPGGTTDWIYFRPLPLEIDWCRSISTVGDRFRMVSTEGTRKKKRRRKGRTWSPVLLSRSVARGRFLRPHEEKKHLPACGEGTR